jgi:tRNA/tmRNA/rRNA uracil-C5-methylase (TrmA/RlmC/RlmD family)
VIVEIERVGHLGVCIGRAEDGRAVLVRHTLPGERVRVRVTEEKSSYLRADAVEILRASPERVEPRCPWSGPGRCGGCDWQHVDLAEQRRLKAGVLAEQLRHLGGISGPTVDELVVEPIPGDAAGLGWRTRMRLAVDRHGVAGLRRHRSRTIQPIGDCPIAHPGLDVAAVVSRRWPPHRDVDLGLDAAAGPSQPVIGDRPTRQSAGGRMWEVPAGGFWQVHPGAADAFVTAVATMLDPLPGEQLVDLYAGVGVFAGSLVAAHGLGSSVAVEGSVAAAESARANLAGLPVDVVTAEVGEWLASGAIADAGPQLVVLDPPRRGAGAAVIEAISTAGSRAIGYVACDPAALARDTAHLHRRGWRLTGLRAFDAFPMTAHVEAIARFEPEARVA